MPDQEPTRFLADENFDLVIDRQRREAGFSITSIAETIPSITDVQVLELAVAQQAILLTEDKDFGELVHRLRMSLCGVLLVRLLKLEPAQKLLRIQIALQQHSAQFENAFAVLSNDHLRIKF